MQDLSELTALAIIPAHNSHGKRDVTGAFRPEAKRFGALFKSCKFFEFDNRAPMRDRKSAVEDKIEGARVDTVAFFCHGWTDGIQAGFKRADALDLALSIREAVPHRDVVIPLYCCSTGGTPRAKPAAGSYVQGCGPGEGSFADVLRDDLCFSGAIDCSVMGHTTVGHTTRNPNALRFAGMGSRYGGVGGFRLVTPGSQLWPKWRKAMRAGTFRFRFPYMTPGEVHAELH